MVHGSLAGQFGHRRQHAQRIGSQKYHNLWMPSHAWNHRTRNVVQRVCDAGVLSEAPVVIVRHAVIQHDVFENRAVFDGVPDLGFGVMTQVDAFCITPTFKVECAVVRPAVLIVSDESSVGISGERGLAGAGKPEEQHGVFVPADVCRTVHRKDVALGQNEVHYCKHGFFDLACISGSADENDLFGQINQYEDFRLGSVDLRDGLKIVDAHDGKLGLVLPQLLVCRSDEHVSRKEALPDVVVDDTDRQAVFRIRAHKAVKHEEFPAVHEFFHLFENRLKPISRKLMVDLSPVDCITGNIIIYDKAVVGRSSRILAGIDRNGSRRVCFAFPALGCHAHHLIHGKIAVYCGGADSKIGHLGRKLVSNYRALYPGQMITPQWTITPVPNPIMRYFDPNQVSLLSLTIEMCEGMLGIADKTRSIFQYGHVVGRHSPTDCEPPTVQP